MRATQPKRGQRKPRAADAQWVRAENRPIGQPVPTGIHVVQRARPIRAFLDPSGGIRFEKAAFQSMDDRIAQPDVVRVTVERSVAIAQPIE